MAPTGTAAVLGCSSRIATVEINAYAEDTRMMAAIMIFDT